MLTFKDLIPLAKKYNYDLNHNLRYLALAKLVEYYHINEILILGCGKGILEYILSDEVKCTSVDINQSEIKIAKEINLGKKNRHFVVSDIHDWIKNSKEKYKAILISEVIEHLSDDKEVIRAIRMAINHNKGLFLLTVPNVNRLLNRAYPFIGRKIKFMSDEHLREYSIREIHRLLSSCGFKVLSTEYVYLRLPKEDFVRKIISVNSRFRNFILKFKPEWANYIVTISSPS